MFQQGVVLERDGESPAEDRFRPYMFQQGVVPIIGVALPALPVSDPICFNRV